jgi:hypothetical protein
MEKKEMEAPK